MQLTRIVVVGIAFTFGSLGLASLAFPDPITAPPSAASVEAGSDNCYPFTCLGRALTAPYQQLYGSSFFAAPVSITSIAFRPDAQFGWPFTSTFSDVQVQLGVTAVDPDGPPTGLVTGTGMTTVYSGSLSVSSQFTGPSGGPKDFDVVINFLSPFFYDPSAGNLLFDFRSLGTIEYSFSTRAQLDAVRGLGTGMSRRFEGFYDSGGLVTQFETLTPVPEPTSLGLLMTGLAGVGLRCWRQRQVRPARGSRRPRRRGANAMSSELPTANP